MLPWSLSILNLVKFEELAIIYIYLERSILKEIKPEYSLEGLMLKLKLQYFGHLMKRASVQFSSVQSLSHVQLFATPWIPVLQASQSIINSQSLPKLMSIEPVMPSNHLILCHPLLHPPSIFPSIRVFSNESVHQVAKVLELQLHHQSFQWIFRTDFL